MIGMQSSNTATMTTDFFEKSQRFLKIATIFGSSIEMTYRADSLLLHFR